MEGKLLSLYNDFFRKGTKITTDSRKVEEGNVFWALKGDRFDGNKFTKKALESGARSAIVDDPEVVIDDRCILVENSLVALQEFARYHRRQFTIPIVAITGTNGKTTTKELVNFVLSEKYKTHYTKGNYNNHIGVPLTLLDMPSDTEIGIIEMGANHPGEIDELCRITEPTHGLITNVGKAHLEGFGGFEGVKKTKSEMYRFLKEKEGLIFINIDENHLENLLPEYHGIIRYGRKITEVSPLETAPFLKVLFEYSSQECNTNLVGGYNYPNVLTAIAIAHQFGVADEDVIRALQAYRPGNNRSQLLTHFGNTIILDAYNANPTSMGVAVTNFAEMQGDKKILIIGDMLELGEDSNQEHQNMIDLTRKFGFDEVFLIGEHFGKCYIREKGYHFFNSTQELKEVWNWKKFKGASFLLKASRGIGLEKLLD